VAGDHTRERAAARANRTQQDRARFIHRELIQLIGLVIVAVAAFSLTRAVAASNREMSLRDAAEWHRRGQLALGAGRVDEAIDDFRRAVVRNRTDKEYLLALARALARTHDDDAARAVLVALRESASEDAEVNLELARLAARGPDVAEAVRYYRNALYAPWAADSGDARRQVRMELIQFLLAHDQAGRALPELLAAAADLPDQAAAHLQLAGLFERAGDDGRALDHFERALTLSPDDGAALAGAGLSAFRLGRYVQARAFLLRAPTDVDGVSVAREIVEHVIADDPLAARIGSRERRRRVTSDLDYVRGRMAACMSAQTSSSPAEADAALEQEAKAFADELEHTSSLDQDTIEAGVDLVDRIARRIVSVCEAPAPRDRAMILIGREHSEGK
jgi:Tfp pilus assembly protein PilF